MDIIDLHFCEKNIHRFELLKEKFPDNINKKITSDFYPNIFYLLTILKIQI